MHIFISCVVVCIICMLCMYRAFIPCTVVGWSCTGVYVPAYGSVVFCERDYGVRGRCVYRMGTCVCTTDCCDTTVCCEGVCVNSLSREMIPNAGRVFIPCIALRVCLPVLLCTGVYTVSNDVGVFLPHDAAVWLPQYELGVMFWCALRMCTLLYGYMVCG